MTLLVAESRINPEADLTDDITTVPTKFLYNPEVIFLDKPVDLEKDKTYRIRIAYPYGCDSLAARFEVEEHA